MPAHNKPIVSFKSVCKSHGEFVVLKNASFALQEGERAGLVGPNGTGKSTLLKLITGSQAADQGTIEKKKGISIGYVPQNFDDDLSFTGKDYLGSDLERCLPLLYKLGLSESLLVKRLSELSGGEKTKIAVSKALSEDHDLFLLDEPTNNLDIQSLEMLEKLIRESGRTFLIVSHDRKFLDRAVGKIFEIDEWKKKVSTYTGTYSEYREARRQKIETEWKHYYEKEGEQKRLKKTLALKVSHIRDIERERLNIRKLNPKLSEKPDDADLRDKESRAGRRAKVMKNRLERFSENTADIEKPREFLPLKLEFEIEERSGDKVFEAKEISKKRGERIIGPIDFTASYGERILISGPNGAGKTTLVDMLLGALMPDSGSIEKGTGLRIGYLPQEGRLKADQTLLEAFKAGVDIEESDGRKILNRFRLAADDMTKKISELSSGERSRLVLAMLVAKKPNCLILDEPSNHLDLEALECLESALSRYAGTLIVVSHDRYLIEKLKFDRIYRIEH